MLNSCQNDVKSQQPYGVLIEKHCKLLKVKEISLKMFFGSSGFFLG